MTDPRILPGCSVLPPMTPATNGKAGSTNGDQADGKADRKSKAKTRTGDRFTVLNAFIDFSMGDLDRAEIAVWFALYRDTKPDGLARTSQADLARRAGTTDRTVRRAIASLERKRLLRIVCRGGLRKGTSTYRVLPLAKPPHVGHGCPPAIGHLASVTADTGVLLPIRDQKERSL